MNDDDKVVYYKQDGLEHTELDKYLDQIHEAEKLTRNIIAQLLEQGYKPQAIASGLNYGLVDLCCDHIPMLEALNHIDEIAEQFTRLEFKQ